MGGVGVYLAPSPLPMGPFRALEPSPCPHVCSSSDARAMNCFPSCCDSLNSSSFFFPRYRHRALTRGLRRHQLQLFGDPLRTLALPALLHAPVCLQHVTTDDDEDGGAGAPLSAPHHHCPRPQRPLLCLASKL